MPCLFKESLETINSLQACGLQSAKEFTIVLSSLTRMALWQRAGNALQKMSCVRVEIDAAARHAALSRSRWQMVQSLLQAESGAKDVNDAACLQAKAYAAAQLWSTATNVLEQVAQMRLQPSIQLHTAVAGGFSTSALWQLACLQVESVEESSQDPQFFTAVAGTCSKAGRWLHTLLLLRRASVRRDVAMFGVLLHALAKGRQLEDVLGVMAEFESSKLRLNSAIVSSALGAFGSSALPEAGRVTYLGEFAKLDHSYCCAPCKGKPGMLGWAADKELH